MRLIDSHAHLAEDRFDEDRDEVLRRAREAGVEVVVVIGYDVDSSVAACAAAAASPAAASDASPALYATVGFAPHNVADATREAMERVRGMLGGERVVAVGEIGLDYHYDMPRDRQRDVFARQLAWAAERRLPAVVHSREAERDVIELIRAAGDEAGESIAGVNHCFTESSWMAGAALELGWYVSFSGILTFKNAADLRAVARAVPLEHTLIETDSPYLAPQPYRGRRNEPSFVHAVAETLAEIHSVSTERVAEVTADNARALFGLG